MPDPTANSGYVTYNFQDLQLDLVNYLNEDETIDGNWEVSEKKRQINHGLVQVAARTFTPKTLIEKSIVATVDEPIGEFTPPSDMLKPIRLFVTESPKVGTTTSSQEPHTNGRQYREIQEEDFFNARRGSTANGGLGSLGLSGRGFAFWYDEAKRLIRLTHDITSNFLYEFYYVKIPAKLVDDGDIPDIDAVYAHLAAMWAAGRLLYRDQEHRDKGISLFRDFETGIADFQSKKFKEAGRKHTSMKLNPGIFKRSRDNAARGNFSASDYWLGLDA